MQDDALDRLLAQAAATPPAPSPELIDRVLADALALQPAAPGLVRHRAQGPGLLRRIAGLFGGVPALTAVSAAAVLGLAVGYLNPSTLDTLASGLTDTGTEDFFPSVDFLTTEG